MGEIQRRDETAVSSYLEWVDGMPIPKFAPSATKGSTTALIAAAASVPFTAPSERTADRFANMTVLEVAAIRLMEAAADGDTTATREVFDRILGKPKQETQNVSVNATYQDYLQQIAIEEGVAAPPVQYTAIEPYNPFENLDGI